MVGFPSITPMLRLIRTSWCRTTGQWSWLLLPMLLIPALAQQHLRDPAPLLAQDRVPIEAVRAINMARTYAVRLNGGLERYRPARCMFATAALSNPCLIRSDEKGFVFRFAGGPPGWEARDEEPTWETEILIAPDGRSVYRLIGNRTLR